MNHTLKQSARALTLLSLLILAGAGCASTETGTSTLPSPTSTATAPGNLTTNQVRYFVPKDIPAYMQAMALYSQEGGATNPALSTEYIELTTTTSINLDPRQAVMEASLANLPMGGGPARATVAYFKVKGDDAYVLLNIHLNGWAGVSAKLAAAQPLIEKNLKRFPGIKRVVFDVAPGDNRIDVQKSLK